MILVYFLLFLSLCYEHTPSDFVCFTSGGIADRPNDVADVFHTYFGLAGLCLLNFEGCDANIDPVYAINSVMLERVANKRLSRFV